MKKRAIAHVTFDSVRHAALALPNVTEGTSWKFPAFRSGKEVFLCFREDLDSILVRASFDQRDEMMETSPETYYTTDHHRPYPWVLARIKTLDPAVVPDLLRMGYNCVRREKK